jgi:chromosome segregation protein
LRLSQIKLSGFKSFVDPTHIHTPGRIVGIVGPNGCGKSNIIDALRWVLGESRASALRGSSMQDVIFNGSGNRKPVARASVELVFDNSQGGAFGQWSNYAEIAVKRILQRDAESSYFINSIRVRRKDVADIFLGTGLGGHAYAIIEQGMISRIIEADPEELKIFLEEAAGISKYKERRRETEHRLKGTRENLLRVEDIKSELAERIGHLEHQASIAKRYHELQASLKTAQNLLWLGRKMRAGEARRKHAQEADKLETMLEAEIANLRGIESKLVELREAHEAMGSKLQEAQGEMYQANAEVSGLQQKIDHVRSNRARLEARIESATREIAGVEQQQSDAAASLEKLESESIEAGRLKRESYADLENRKAVCDEARAILLAARSRHDEKRRSLSLAEQDERVEETHRAHVQRSLGELERRREKLIESSRNRLAPDESRLSGIEAALAGASEAVASQRQDSNTSALRLESMRAARAQVLDALREEEKRHAEIKARLAALQGIQADIEKAAHFDERIENLPRLRSSIRIRDGWEHAFEAVLSGRVNAVLAPWEGGSPKGEATFVQGGAWPPIETSNASLVPLLSFIDPLNQEFGGALCDWFRHAYAAQDIGEALKMRPMLETGEFLVTREGFIVTPFSIHCPGKGGQGVLAREREIESLVETESTSAASLEVLQKNLKDMDEGIFSCEKEMKDRAASIAALEKEQHSLQLERIRLSEEHARYVEQSARIDAEAKEIDAQIEAEVARKMEVDGKLHTLRESVGSLRENLIEMKCALDQAESGFEERNTFLQHAEKKCREVEFQEKSCTIKFDELKGRIEFLTRSMMQGRENLDALLKEHAAQDAALLEKDLQVALVQREEKEICLADVRKTSEALSFELREIDRSRQETERKLEPMRERIAGMRLKEQEARLNEAQLEESLGNAGADIETLAGLLDKAPESHCQAEITKLSGEIESLGAVNLAAYDELQEALERLGYLDAQVSDLNLAIETLETAIRKIDRETRERLKSTFDEVNNNFSDLFHQAFGGGQARLVLTGEQIIDSGMEIEAQPPGKKNASIRLLSGGEKALTAISLVFALFKLNPAPFCLLDEVDAPLDDSNTERFCDMVRKMSEHTQFLFISHNKITMEMAHQLVGVTMQEQGVSRIVAVDVGASKQRALSL